MRPTLVPILAVISLSSASLILPRIDYEVAIDRRVHPLYARQDSSSASESAALPTSAPVTTTAPAVTTDTPTSTPVNTPTSTPNQESSAVGQTSSHVEASTPASATNSPSATTPRDTPQTPAPIITTKPVTTTDEHGGLITIIQTVTGTPTGTSSSAAPSTTGDAGDDSGIGTKSIVAMAVAGGLFVIGLAGFIYWKFTKKRFSGFDNDADNIKWPELKDANAMQPIPARSGTSTPAELAGEFDHRWDTQSVKTTSPYAYDNHSVVSSSADLTRGPIEHASNEPYGAPVPGGQYYDEPRVISHAATPSHDGQSVFYDPYRGPIPSSLDGHSPVVPGYPSEAGRRSPGPNFAYGGSRSASPAIGVPRATSPGPNMAYAPRSGSPGPNAAYNRAPSPGPNMAYAPRSTSPGPNAAYGVVRSGSPGPNVAYGVPTRSTSPGPNVAYGNGEAR